MRGFVVWSLGFLWSLVLGIWSFGAGGNVMSSGDCTVIPGYQFAGDAEDRVTYAKLNSGFTPAVRVNAASIGTRELIPGDVRQLVPYVNRNVLINGNFDVWQRGGFINFSGLPNVMGAGSGPDMGADRWYLGIPSGANKRNVSRGAFTLGQTSVPNEPTYYLHWNELVAETGGYQPALYQLIEDVRTLAGKQVVVSWWMKGNVSGNITCSMAQFFGGSPGETNPITADSGGTAVLASGADWAKYTAKFTIPALTGHSISGAGDYLALVFLLPNTTFQIDFAQVQLEEGTAATAFESLPYLETLRKCERYFEYHGGVAGTSVAVNPTCYYFATRKYRAPTLSLIPGYAGTMTAANFSTILDTGYYQDTANSVVSVFYMACEAEISMP